MKKNLTPTSSSKPELTRRQFLAKSGRGAVLAGLLAGLPKGWVGAAYASDAPETSAVSFGIIALTDCSPIVIAHEKGLFK
jgi:nitrate/nitrite transport system substrate-binding protein